MATILPQLLQALVKERGSDLHLSANSSPMFRIKGDLNKVEMPALKQVDMEAIVAEITTNAQKTTLVKERSIDFSMKMAGVGIFRVNVFFQRHGLGAVFRALSEKPPTLEDLNLPPVCKAACRFPNGLVLVTGPTGSGKSTTLAAMVNYINMNEKGHILTLEDPIEFHHETKRCMVNQRQLGTHFTDFASALRGALREDPDVILVGEMRDPETIALAITAAETGHLVFATLHTNSAPKAIDRILDSFPSDQQPQIRTMLSESLRAVISQKLVPTADGKGRIAIHDIMVSTPAVANMIREGKTFQIPSVMQTGRKDGMQVMDYVLQDAVQKQLVTGATAWEFANDKQMFAQYAPRESLGATIVATQPSVVNSSGSMANPTNLKKTGT